MAVGPFVGDLSMLGQPERRNRPQSLNLDPVPPPCHDAAALTRPLPSRAPVKISSSVPISQIEHAVRPGP